MKKKREDGLGEKFFVDGHVDLPYFMMNYGHEGSFKDLQEGSFTFKKATESGVRLFCTAIYCQDLFNGQEAFRHYSEVFHFTRKSMESLRLIKNEQDLDAIKDNTEDLGTLFLLENADCLAGNTSHIEELKENGILAVGLTHAGSNRLGDGNNIRFSQGLTDAGRDIVRLLIENGTLLDVAHLHPACFRQMLDLVEAPIISSHTGIREVFDIQRNIDLEQAGEIFERGGIVGISLNPEMLAPEGTSEVNSVFVHLDTVVQKFGPDGVGIGSDFCGFDASIEGMEDISGIGHLVEELLNHGYGYRAVEKIMGENWFNMYKRVLAGEG